MRIWTTQTVPFWNKLQEQGVAFCDPSKSEGSGDFKEAYDWMVVQMIKRLGPPPRLEIIYPVWGWQQVGSYKKEYHGSICDCGGKDDEFMFITAEIPDNLTLLSDFDWWHCVLNHWYADTLKHKKEPDEEAAIIKSWDNIFDLNRRGHGIKYRRNRWIQATFWELRKEWVVSAQRVKGYQKWQAEQMKKWGKPNTD